MYAVFAVLTVVISVLLAVHGEVVKNRTAATVQFVTRTVLSVCALFLCIIVPIILKGNISSLGDENLSSWASNVFYLFKKMEYSICIFASVICLIAALIDHSKRLTRVIIEVATSLIAILIVVFFASMTENDGVSVDTYVYLLGIGCALLPNFAGIADDLRTFRAIDTLGGDAFAKERRQKRRGARIQSKLRRKRG